MKIECSHCKRMVPANRVFDRDWTHTICFDCSQKDGHNNTKLCPKCGLKKPERCVHQLLVLAIVSGTKPGEFQLTKCQKCDQKRAHEIPGGEVASCNHCGLQFTAPTLTAENFVVGPTICLKCSGEGHSMHGGECQKCLDLKPAPGPTTLECHSENYKMHLEIMKNVEEIKKGLGQGPTHEAALKTYQKLMDVQATNEAPKEDVTCPHCGAAFKVKGDIKTWDTVYMTCMDCYQKGHRRRPEKCEVCVGGLVGIAKEIAAEGLKALEKAAAEEDAKNKYGRNIVL